MKSALGTGIMYFILYIFCKDIENDVLKITTSILFGSITYAIVELIIKNPPALLIFNTLKKKVLKK